jgi:hypothetical protein
MVSVVTVVLQQVSSAFAQANARKTLNKPILLKYLLKYLSADEFAKIASVCTDGYVYIWGSKDERVHQYGKIPPGWSLALFRRNKTVIKCGLIIAWVHNPDLAKEGLIYSPLIVHWAIRGERG